MSNENQKEISEAFYKLMTLNGQFDFTKVVTTLNWQTGKR